MGIFVKPKKCFFDPDFYFSSEVDFYLESILEYITLTEETIKENVTRPLTKYHELLRKDSDEIEDYIEDLLIKEKIPNIFYSSILISQYSFLEQSMSKLCIKAESSQTIKLEDIQGKGIFQSKRYLEKVLEIDFIPLNDLWNKITNYNTLRNHFVHSSTFEIENNSKDNSKNNSKKKLNKIREIDYITLKELGSKKHEILISDSRVLKNFNKIINEFLSKIYHE